FKLIGKQLLDLHVLFDICPDDIATDARCAAYRQVLKLPYPDKVTADTFTGLSRFEAPSTVRVSVSRPSAGKELTVHLVNYNRKEPDKKRSPGRGYVDDNPISVADIKVDMLLPSGMRVKKVTAISPEAPDIVAVPAESQDGRLRFTMP